MLRAIIFDFDGLILDTETPIYTSWEELYCSLGGHLDVAYWVKRVVGTVSNELDHFESLEAQLGRPVDRAALSPQRRQREKELVELQPIQPGVLTYLQEARQLGLRTGVASSSPCHWVTGHLQRLGLLPYFDCVRARDDVSRVKPDPQLYLDVLADLGVRPEEALALEDSPIGVTAAKLAGVFCVAVPNALTRMLSFDHADLCLHALTDLPLRELIKKVEKIKSVAA